MPDINIYIEKVHIFEKGQTQQILLVIFKSQMFFLFINKETFYMKPISIVDDIK
jgi:hypothetical protein